jgi:hypothetical protein
MMILSVLLLCALYSLLAFFDSSKPVLRLPCLTHVVMVRRTIGNSVPGASHEAVLILNPESRPSNSEAV